MLCRSMSWRWPMLVHCGMSSDLVIHGQPSIRHNFTMEYLAPLLCKQATSALTNIHFQRQCGGQQTYLPMLMTETVLGTGRVSKVCYMPTRISVHVTRQEHAKRAHTHRQAHLTASILAAHRRIPVARSFRHAILTIPPTPPQLLFRYTSSVLLSLQAKRTRLRNCILLSWSSKPPRSKRLQTPC